MLHDGLAQTREAQREEQREARHEARREACVLGGRLRHGREGIGGWNVRGMLMPVLRLALLADRVTV